MDFATPKNYQTQIREEKTLQNNNDSNKTK